MNSVFGEKINFKLDEDATLKVLSVVSYARLHKTMARNFLLNTTEESILAISDGTSFVIYRKKGEYQTITEPYSASSLEKRWPQIAKKGRDTPIGLAMKDAQASLAWLAFIAIQQDDVLQGRKPPEDPSSTSGGDAWYPMMMDPSFASCRYSPPVSHDHKTYDSSSGSGSDSSS